MTRSGSNGSGIRKPPGCSSSWTTKYGEKFRLHWIRHFPEGIVAPRRVRIYRRADYYLVMWWEPALKKNLSDRVEGDLVAAIARARHIEERLRHFKASGQVRQQRRLPQAELVAQFLADLRQRADAGAIEPATVRRYEAGLAHYLAFCEQPAVARTCPHAGGVNRAFRLGLEAFLATRQVTSNGRAGSGLRPMTGQRFVLDTVRALFAWAADPDRGGLLPEGFRNPFLRPNESRSLLKGDPLAQPDITLPMAVRFVGACDDYQLRLFVPMLLFGLRAAEPCFLFVEYLEQGWLRVPCNPDLAYRTKGRRDKRFPLLESLASFWESLQQGRDQGLLYERRSVMEGRERAPLRQASLAAMVAEFERRCAARRALDAAGRLRLRDQVLREAGGLTYDHVQGEFEALARQLGWPAKATLKDFRHLFATTMHNAAMPEAYRRYLMGQAPGKAAIVAYTHLNDLQRHYAEAVRGEWMPLLAAINQRVQDLRTTASGDAVACGK